MSNDEDDRARLPDPGEGKRGTEGHIGYLLRQAAQAHRTRIDRALADLGLTQPQFAVLTMLAAYPGRSNADLARLALLTPQTMSVIVGNLLEAGLISRRPHPIHRRIRELTPTPAGERTLETAKARVATLDATLLSGLSGEAEATVRRWLVETARG
ncbi:MAG: MarR family transcriptional regulator [Hyphomicrobiales bacterium]|nr:MarR family transcriptional regulator [Hyphomicrobiales bacterium]